MILHRAGGKPGARAPLGLNASGRAFEAEKPATFPESAPRG